MHVYLTIACRFTCSIVTSVLLVLVSAPDLASALLLSSTPVRKKASMATQRAVESILPYGTSSTYTQHSTVVLLYRIRLTVRLLVKKKSSLPEITYCVLKMTQGKYPLAKIVEAIRVILVK